MYNNIIGVTNRHLSKGDFLVQIRRICELHPKAIILREKDLSEDAYEELAKKVCDITHQYGVECRLHFFWEKALKLGISSIHLPLWKLSEMPEDAKEKFSVIGTSVHSLDEAKEAQRIGSSYLIAGHIYATDCKKGVLPRGIGFLREICENTTIPVYGIGGIHLEEEQIKEVMGTGAQGVCIMSEIMRV